MHEAVIWAGAARVMTTIQIDDRRDKELSMARKVESVREKLAWNRGHRMRSEADTSREGCGAIGLTVFLAFVVMIVCVSFAMVPKDTGNAGYGWKGTLTEEVVLGWALCGALVGLLAANIVPGRRWVVGAPLVAAAELVPFGLLTFVGSAMSEGRTTSLGTQVQAGVWAGIAAGVAILVLLPAKVSKRRRLVTNLTAVAAILLVPGFCHVRGASYLAKADRVVVPAVEQWLNSEVLAGGGKLELDGFRWYGWAGDKPYACSDGRIEGAGIKAGLRVLPGRGQRSLEGVDVPVYLHLRTGGVLTVEQVSGPGSMAQALGRMGLKPELAAQFVAGGAGYAANCNGFVWKVSGATQIAVPIGQTAPMGWQGHLEISTTAAYSTQGMKPGSAGGR